MGVRFKSIKENILQEGFYLAARLEVILSHVGPQHTIVRICDHTEKTFPTPNVLKGFFFLLHKSLHIS